MHIHELESMQKLAILCLPVGHQNLVLVLDGQLKQTDGSLGAVSVPAAACTLVYAFTALRTFQLAFNLGPCTQTVHASKTTLAAMQ